MQITCLPSFGYDLHLDQCSCGPLDALKDVITKGFIHVWWIKNSWTRMQKLNNLSNMSNMTTTTLGFLLLNFRSHVLDRMAGQCFVGSDWHSCGERSDSPWQAGIILIKVATPTRKMGFKNPLSSRMKGYLLGFLGAYWPLIFWRQLKVCRPWTPGFLVYHSWRCTVQLWVFLLCCWHWASVLWWYLVCWYCDDIVNILKRSMRGLQPVTIIGFLTDVIQVYRLSLLVTPPIR